MDIGLCAVLSGRFVVVMSFPRYQVPTGFFVGGANLYVRLICEVLSCFGAQLKGLGVVILSECLVPPRLENTFVY
jgi:hypothetical protein